MTRKSLIFSLIALILFAGVTPAPPTQAQGGPAIDYENLVVVEVKELDIDVSAAYLSPDGQRIAGIRADELIIFSAAGEPLRRLELRAAGLIADPKSVRWSPDSARLAMTEDLFGKFHEPDIWVVEVETGKIVNLTDDQESDFVPGAAADNLDLLPAWAPDSERLFFIRYRSGGQASALRMTRLFSIDIAHGEPRLERTFEGVLGTPFFSLTSLSVAPDGKTIALSVSAPDLSAPANGMWAVTLNGWDAQQLIAGLGLYDARFSADGRYLMGEDLLTAQRSERSGEQWAISTSRTALVESRREIALDAGRGAHWGAWSPTGAAVAYIVRAPQQPEIAGLYVAAEPGQPGRLVYQAESLSPASAGSWLMPTWASNNTLLLMNRERRLLLLRFAPGEQPVTNR